MQTGPDGAGLPVAVVRISGRVVRNRSFCGVEKGLGLGVRGCWKHASARERYLTCILAGAVLCFCAGSAVLKPVEQNQYDDADPDHEDREHDNQLLAIHTLLPSV